MGAVHAETCDRSDLQGDRLFGVQSSLKDLNSKVDVPMDMNRFRANIVIDDSVAPWEEDNWQSFTLGGAPDRAVTFHSLKPCSRCKVPC